MYKIAIVLIVVLAATNSVAENIDADVIVIGAGPAGLAAAIEAADQGVTVSVLEMNSVPGGHAVMAGGFALVGTALQAKKGIEDNPDLAYRDWMEYGENGDAQWTRQYAQRSAAEVYDWLTNLGVEFRLIIPTPDSSVPRFHFTRGTSVHVIVPLMRAALQNKDIEFRFNRKALMLERRASGVLGVAFIDQRNGTHETLHTRAVVLATGGFQGDLEQVRAAWSDKYPQPERILIGGSRSALGTGHDLAESVGGQMVHLDRQVVFPNGVPNPREPSRALIVRTQVAIWVNAQGRRFVNEAADDKVVVDAMLSQRPATYWMIYDADGSRKIAVRDALWLNRDSIRAEILENRALTHTADSLDRLASIAGLPADEFVETVRTYNAAVQSSSADSFGRFAAGEKSAKPILRAPFYATQLYPVTRKNMGGVKIDSAARVLDIDGKPVAGLYAAGELTGVAGINGSHGMAGTFLGPSVFTGRIAGRAAAADHGRTTADGMAKNTRHDDLEEPVALNAESLRRLLDPPRPGYSHFEQAHRLVQERQYACEVCHSENFPAAPTEDRDTALAQLSVCETCH
jgi:flavocytochrome c